MSVLLDIRDKLRDTHAAVVRMESELSANRDDEGLSLMLESLIQRQESLEAAFLEAACREQIEVCSYQLIREQNQTLPIAALARPGTFQTWLTTVFDAIKSGPKEKARPSIEMVQQTTLDFGYVFAGSLGIVFTVPNERLLFGESDLDLAVDAMFKMVHSRKREELVEFAHRFGMSAIGNLRLGGYACALSCFGGH